LAKFHYVIQVPDLVADLVSDLSQTGSSYLDMSVQAILHYAVLLGSMSATSSRAGCELDSVMEFGFNAVSL